MNMTNEANDFSNNTNSNKLFLLLILLNLKRCNHYILADSQHQHLHNITIPTGLLLRLKILGLHEVDPIDGMDRME